MRIRTLLVALILAVIVPSTASQETSTAQRLALATGSVYAEFALQKDPTKKAWAFAGTAWAYKSDDRGTIWITNAHVISNAGRLDSKLEYWGTTGVYGIRLQGRHILPAEVLKIDEEKDLAALRTKVRAPAVPCVAARSPLEGEEVVNVSHPLTIRYMVFYGLVARRFDPDGYEFDEVEGLGGIAPEFNKYKGGHLWLDIRSTHGSSGSAVATVSDGCVVGVIRGYWVAGGWFQMGQPLVYAIPAETVQKFLASLNGNQSN